MVSSPVALSISTVLCLFGFALVVLAALSDNWIEYQVDRKRYGQILSQRGEINEQTTAEYRKETIFFSRNYGLIHICFPDEVPSDIGSYIKFTSTCVTNTDYFPDNSLVESFNSVQSLRLWFMRGMLLMYLIGLFFCALSMLFGIVGCYKRNPTLITGTGLILFLGVLSLFTSLMLWHVIGYYERKVLTVPPFFMSWNQPLKQATRIAYGWSYVCNIVGIVVLLMATIALFYSKCVINREEDVFQGKNSSYNFNFSSYYPTIHGGGGMGNNEKALVPSGFYGAPAAYGNPYGTGIYGYYPPPSAYYGASGYYGYYGH